jgi:DNA (cytosine-5)-methyltransferase 1
MARMSRPLLLDLFCGAGGAAVGYHRAGFDVVGVDILPQPRYPFPFIQGDALNPPVDLSRFDAIHASPPCQAHTALKAMWNSRAHPELIEPTRNLLESSGLPYVIENVPGSPTRALIVLCGTMFRLGTGDAELWRHRRFETSFLPELVPPCEHYSRRRVVGVYGGHGRDRRRGKPRVCRVHGHSGGSSTRDGTQQFTVAERREAMGIDWMTGAELSQAIPPAYTEFIGRQLLRAL